MTHPFLSIRDFGVRFPVRSESFRRGRYFYAVRHISLDVRKKETFCLVGESGSGKTTLVWAILGLYPFAEGEMAFCGRSIKRSNDPVHQALISNAQMVFQDPVAAVSPFLTLGQSIEEPLRARGVGKKERAAIAQRLAAETGLSHELLGRRPCEVSDGQNQRVCIARALSTKPAILFLDEPLTALDAIVQREVAELLYRMKKDYNATFFLVTHDLDFVKRCGTTVAVMYLGKIVERAAKETFFSNPCHPFSQALLSSVLKPGIWKGERIVLKGESPSPQNPPSGCVFHTRCPRRLPVCEKTAPEERLVGAEHAVCCHLF
ncbi:MAG: ABC transporter ATP-binding protein [Proteobacteria bacterium]|nr:ABC transporter ATP-binding protein [Pseudomonadota bacterium]